MKSTLVLALLGMALCQAFGQEELIGYRQYPQFRTTSGLAGSGMPVDENGMAGRRGALSVSIPIGYSFVRDNYLVGGSFTGDSFGLRRANTTDFGNGSAWGLAGFDGAWGRATVGIMFLSGTFDNVFNLQYQLPLKGRVGVSVGVQDLVGDGGASGDAIDDVEHLSSRSFFASATHKLTDGVYISGGLGTNRFRFGFAGLSWNMREQFTAPLEHDGFNFNAAVAWHPNLSPNFQGALNLGTIRGKYLYVAATVRF